MGDDQPEATVQWSDGISGKDILLDIPIAFMSPLIYSVYGVLSLAE